MSISKSISKGTSRSDWHFTALLVKSAHVRSECCAPQRHPVPNAVPTLSHILPKRPHHHIVPIERDRCVGGDSKHQYPLRRHPSSTDGAQIEHRAVGACAYQPSIPPSAMLAALPHYRKPLPSICPLSPPFAPSSQFSTHSNTHSHAACIAYSPASLPSCPRLADLAPSERGALGQQRRRH